MHRTALPVRGGVALRADPGALEAVGIAADASVPAAAADARVGAGSAVALHFRRAAVLVADARPHRADRVGVHDRASAALPMRSPADIDQRERFVGGGLFVLHFECWALVVVCRCFCRWGM